MQTHTSSALANALSSSLQNIFSPIRAIAPLTPTSVFTFTLSSVRPATLILNVLLISFVVYFMLIDF